MSKLFKLLFTALTATWLCMAVLPAHAVPQQTFTLNGNCADCAAQANQATYGVTGTLVLQNYTFGAEFDLSNFISFSYSGSNKSAAFTWYQADMWTNFDAVSGHFSGSPDNLIYFVNLNKAPNANGDVEFFVGPTQISANDPTVYDFNLGTILGGNSVTKDYGFATWSTVLPPAIDNNVPEPGSLLLAGLALAALGLARRRKG